MKSKIDFVKIVACALVIILFTVMFFVLPDRDFSQKENRTLEPIPEFGVSELFSGEYTTALARYISDQFPFRDAFVGVKAYSELLLGKMENNGVIYADGVLVARNNTTGERLKDNLQSIKEFENTTGVSVCVAIVPRTIDVFSERLPKTYPSDLDKKIWQDYFDCTKEVAVNAPNLYDELCAKNNYYYTDHHYNVYGAYQVYGLLADSLRYSPQPIESFKIESVSNNFCGTAMRSSGFYLAKKDEIKLFRYKGDEKYTVTADGQDIKLYDMSKLNTTDQYGVFLGGNHARVDISNGENRSKLLVIRDSFADSLAPFLAMHYDLIMIDLRYFTGNVAQIVADENISQVLVLESMSEFSTTKNISYLRRGFEK